MLDLMRIIEGSKCFHDKLFGIRMLLLPADRWQVGGWLGWFIMYRVMAMGMESRFSITFLRTKKTIITNSTGRILRLGCTRGKKAVICLPANPRHLCYLDTYWGWKAAADGSEVDKRQTPSSLYYNSPHNFSNLTGDVSKGIYLPSWWNNSVDQTQLRPPFELFLPQAVKLQPALLITDPCKALINQCWHIYIDACIKPRREWNIFSFSKMKKEKVLWVCV